MTVYQKMLLLILVCCLITCLMNVTAVFGENTGLVITENSQDDMEEGDEPEKKDLLLRQILLRSPG